MSYKIIEIQDKYDDTKMVNGVVVPFDEFISILMRAEEYRGGSEAYQNILNVIYECFGKARKK